MVHLVRLIKVGCLPCVFLSFAPDWVVGHYLTHDKATTLSRGNINSLFKPFRGEFSKSALMQLTFAMIKNSSVNFQF